MRSWQKLVFVLFVATAIGSAVSHAAIHWLKIRSGYSDPQQYGHPEKKAQIILHGSSLAYDGLDWNRIANVLGAGIESWATAGSSPSEWEQQHDASESVHEAIVVVSTYDLNEYWLSDFRADIVPLGDAIRDLKYCKPDGQLCKRILSQYPQMLVRKLFPTVGRSDGVMIGIRAELIKLAGGASGGDVEDGPKIGATNASAVAQKLTDWSPARLQRRLVLMRTGFQGKHWFDGPKKAALMRLLEQARRQGSVVMIVMPVSPTYQREFVGPQVSNEFEEALADLQKSNPRMLIVRLDHLHELDHDQVFSDLVHLNMYGQQIATAALLQWLGQRAISP
jgi:hypothetical protein